MFYKTRFEDRCEFFKLNDSDIKGIGLKSVNDKSVFNVLVRNLLSLKILYKLYCQGIKRDTLYGYYGGV
jgi:hypothetical protein